MMENKILFEVDTAWPFPVLQYGVNTSYVEVRKASGIAYILLQLISSSDNNSDSLVATLKAFGVPSDIHYIFASELANMISYGIIQVKAGRDYSSDLIDMYVISDFEITELGRKLFAEGTIPTGNNQVKKLHVYYDISRKDTQARLNWKMFRFENSTLDKKCIGEVLLDDSDVEMFINDNMNKYAFRKGERISGFEHEQPEILVYKMEDAVSLSIDSGKLQIKAKDKDRDMFIHKYYDADTITRIIDAKRKYQFSENVAVSVQGYDFDNMTNIVKLNMPSQFINIINTKNQLALSCDFELKGSECIVNNEESAEIMDKCNLLGVACYFENGNLYSIIPGRFLIAVDGLAEKCEVNLVATQLVTDDVKVELMRELFLKCIDNSNPLSRCEIIKKLTQISNCKDYVEQFSDSLLRNESAPEDKINLFLKLNEEFSAVKEWKVYSKESATKLLKDLCDNVTIVGFSAQNKLGRKMNKIVGLNDIEYLSQFARKLLEDEDEITVFDVFEGEGFSTDVVLSVVNVFGSYCAQILEGEHINGNSKLSGYCMLLGQALAELKEHSGIQNPYEDPAELDFDNERFIQIIATFSDSIKKVERYKTYAIDEYNLLLAFQERFMELKEFATIEKEALKNPKNINEKYIEQRLKKSRYKDAICDLHVRLQYELNRLFGTEGMPTFELLTNPDMKKYLDESEISSMHLLRKCRNGFQHPKDKREVQYSEKIIREWCSVVEKIGGISDESCSED